MKTISREAMQAADRRMIEVYGVPGLVLMEHAALAMRPYCKDKALILCGPGNNGGDGFALARLLFLQSKNPRILIYSGQSYQGDAEINRQAAENLGIPMQKALGKIDLLEEEIKGANQIIDCLFGIGLDRPIEEPIYSAIAKVNQSGLPILSCDIPSGIDANTGEIRGIAVEADQTITFHAMKKGMLGLDNVKVADIGILDLDS